MSNKSILITGGTGSFGHAFVEYALEHLNPERLIVFSRDEVKQLEMKRRFPDERMRWFIGDVRDRERLEFAFRRVDIVIHAAALKQVPLGQLTPSEFTKTNVIGTQNVIDAADYRGVGRVVFLSTDKAVAAINHYGKSKALAESSFIMANKDRETKYSAVRYGNIAGSRGSVIPFFLEKCKTGVIPITDEKMTRFMMKIEDSVKLVLNALKMMEGGEIYVPKIPSVMITDLARIIGVNCEFETIGIRPGEKLHEVLISKDEARNTADYDKFYTIWREEDCWAGPGIHYLIPENFEYTSDTNDWWLTDKEIREIINEIQSAAGLAAYNYRRRQKCCPESAG